MKPEEAIGVKDHGDNTLLLIKDLGVGPGMNNICVILTNKGDLRLQQIQEVIPIITNKKPSFIFRTVWPVSPFSLKGAGHTYFGKDNNNRYYTTYKMDYDTFGNMIVTPIFGGNGSRKPGPLPKQIFMTKLQVFMVRYKRDKLRKKLKEERWKI